MGDALNFLSTSLRPDIFIKYAYAKALISLGHVPESLKDMYLKSIYSFNSFYEDEPRKWGPDKFIASFNALIESMSRDGFRPKAKDEPILISLNNDAVNAAHRIAVAAALDISIPFKFGRVQKTVFDFQFFVDRKLDPAVLAFALTQKVSINSKLQCLIVHGCVDDSTAKIIEELVKSSSTIFLGQKCKLSLDELTILKFINYALFPDNLSWQGNVQNSYIGLSQHAKRSSGQFLTRFYFLQDIQDEQLIKLKERCRELSNLGNYAIHTAETHEEVFEITQFLFRFATGEMGQFGIPAVINLFDEFKNIHAAQRNLVMGRDDLLIGGSILLELHGLRRARDIDVFVSPERFSDMANDTLSLSRVSISNLPSVILHYDVREVFLDPELSFRFLGLNFLSLKLMRELKQARHEFPKDSFDLELLDELFQSNPNGAIFRNLKLKTLRFFWLIGAFRHLVYSKLYSLLHNSPRTHQRLRVMKHFLKRYI